MSDLIDRQAAIDAIKIYWKRVIDDIPKDIGFEEMAKRCDLALEHNSGILKAINNLPSAQPEPKWIPCSERLPEEHEWIGTKKFGTTISDEVYVTFENEKGERFCQHMTFQNGELSRYDKVHMEVWYKGSKPIAWMPLPEPWKGDSDETD